MTYETPHTILVIEDDHDTRVLLRTVLELHGYRVVSAACGSHALELLKEMDPPSLIVLDLMMPVMSGHEFLREIQKSEVLRAVPVVIVSAFPDLLAKTPNVPFLQKPFSLDALMRTVSRWDSPSGHRVPSSLPKHA